MQFHYWTLAFSHTQLILPHWMSTAATAAQDVYIKWGLQWSSIGRVPESVLHYSNWNYSALVYYDYALTFPREVKYIWRAGSHKKFQHYSTSSADMLSYPMSSMQYPCQTWSPRYALKSLYIFLSWIFQLVCRGSSIYFPTDADDFRSNSAIYQIILTLLSIAARAGIFSSSFCSNYSATHLLIRF